MHLTLNAFSEALNLNKSKDTHQEIHKNHTFQTDTQSHKTFNHPGITKHKADEPEHLFISIIITHFVTNGPKYFVTKTFNFGVPSQRLVKNATNICRFYLDSKKKTLHIKPGRSISVVLFYKQSLGAVISINIQVLYYHVIPLLSNQGQYHRYSYIFN